MASEPETFYRNKITFDIYTLFLYNRSFVLHPLKRKSVTEKNKTQGKQKGGKLK